MAELSRTHRRAAQRIMELATEQELDPVQLMLTISVIIFCGDFLDLDDPSEVERIQTSYACLLQR